MRDETILKSLSVLYVEDDDILRVGLGKYLRRRFGATYFAQHGKEGLDLYIEHDPDIVITDIEMPIMSGNAMIEKILEIDKDQPIIITTAFNDDEHTSRGVCANLIKPIDVDKLTDAIYHCIGEVTA
ncbi:MAG: response regulator [Nitrospirae bacterium]|nr:response regulator [Nitrospirota bacterium]